MATVPQKTAYVHKNGNAQLKAFGCNGKTPQTAVTVNAAVANAAGNPPTQTEFNNAVALLNQIRAALVADGILQ